jgi:DNA-binding MarR family transcriptional regulator
MRIACRPEEPLNDTNDVILSIDTLGVNMKHRTAMEPKGMASARAGKAAASAVAGKSEAIAALVLDVAQCFFRWRALGRKTGFITGWGGGAYGFLRSLALLGPLTVPAIARMRPTSRQRMQRLANELAAEGLVEFVGNPKHRRSKLVRLTPKGDARYRRLSTRLLEIASTMGAGLGEADVRKATEIVRQIGEEAKAR